MGDDDQENFHFSAGVRIDSDYRGNSGDPRYRPARKSTVAREGVAWEAVFIAADQEQARTPL
eukprot:1189897-Pleurochrysis_carterae.AAC.1